MSRENIDKTLGAVERALSELEKSLSMAGFREGAPAYQQMASIVIGQKLWASSRGINEFDSRFETVGALAVKVRAYLLPYLEVMESLAGLRGLVEQSNEVDPKSVAGATLAMLLEESSPRSFTQIRTQVGVSTHELRIGLDLLVRRGLVKRSGRAGRIKYYVAR